jgi:hypothetical protein
MPPLSGSGHEPTSKFVSEQVFARDILEIYTNGFLSSLPSSALSNASV